ncbi:MAG: hypothetical protein ABII97_02935 [Patescibacteria group bacterium]
MKRLLTSILFLSIFLFPAFAFAQEQTVKIYFFESELCPFCAKEKAFLDKLMSEMPNIEILDFELSKNQKNADLLKKIGKELSVSVENIPITFIGNRYFTGYANDEITGKLIVDLINENIKNGYPNIVGQLVMEEIPQNNMGGISQKISEKVKIPFFGEIETKKVSLPFLTIAIAAVDGFNPCAMWVLIFLISLLLGMKDKRKMWILGLVFIAASALVYLLFLSAWLNLFLFLGFVTWVRIVIGLVAVGSGVYYLKKYFTDRADVCVVSESNRQQKIFNKLKKIAQEKHFWLALTGIILLAFAVNLVELICSAGLPAIYTNVLSFSDLSVVQHYSYLLLYVLIFMLDDIIIFAIAMFTLKNVAFTKKYSRASAFIGGILITLIGLLMLFRPEWLMFS